MSQIQLVTAPVIKHDLYAVGASVLKRLADLNLANQVATEDTIGALKKLRAELNKELAEFEAQRKAIKEAVSSPYQELEAVYKSEVSDKYKAAGDLLKDKITEVEDRIKSNTLEEVKSYFVELCLSKEIDFLSWAQLGIDIKLSESMKSYKDRIIAFVSKVEDELNLIDTQNFKAEILVEYKKTLNAAKAIKDVQDRKQAEKLEQDRIKMMQANKRKSVLVGLSFVYHDLTKTYNYVNDESMMISLSDIEGLSQNEFDLRIVMFQASIDEMKRRIATQTVESAPVQQVSAPVQQKSAPVQQAPATPLSAPIEVKPKIVEEMFTATFEVLGTYTQLKTLSEYLKQNSINYKNL